MSPLPFSPASSRCDRASGFRGRSKPMTPTKHSLIFLPEETGRPIVRADTAVAYLEAGQPESLGHRMAAAETMYDRLLDIKRLAESADDSGYEAYALLDLIAQEARAALSAVGDRKSTRLNSSHL